MNKIKFSHKYYKMPSAFSISRLAQVIILDESEISKDFREYDTCYHDKNFIGEGFYPLPKGKLLLLLLIANCGKGWLWCTMRHWTPEKEKYYKSIVGQDVSIEIEEVIKCKKK